jgi:bifunctional non-homologous end joining protein LigD
VVQKHRATRLHYDFRLELEGTLRSWAVPKGPSADPREKRLAVEVEDHPVEYADFEGVIPKGNYGAGPVIVWDRGWWKPVGDAVQGLAEGKLVFELGGYKLKGEWTLVRIKKSPKDWLLIKHRDGHVDPDGKRPYPEESVFSGRTVEEVGQGASGLSKLLAEVEKLKVPRRAVRAKEVGLMLAEAREEPFSGKGWIFELKYDGFRVLAERNGDQAMLRYRRGLDATTIYPEVAQAVRMLPCDQFVLDGEVVVLDKDGQPNFQQLQKRARITRAADAAEAAAVRPGTFFAFDILGLGGRDLRGLPLLERKTLLRRLLPQAGPLRYADHIEEKGEPFFAAARARGLEGIVAKRADAPYRAGRSGAWVKIRDHKTADVVVVGYTPPQGARVGLGSLQVAFHDGERLIYAGGVGTGYTDKLLTELLQKLEPLKRTSPPCTGAIPKGVVIHWVEPRLVAEIRYHQITDEHLLRQSVFVRLRDDKAPDECLSPEGPFTASEAVEAAVAVAGPRAKAEKTLKLSNLDKVYWPGEGITKGEFLDYYRTISPWMLPYLRDRPAVLTRFPDGIEGKSFFQKDAPDWTPGWIRTVAVWSEDTQRELKHFVCDDVETLIYVANTASIPIHVWSSRARDLQRPDWSIIDLDPKAAPFKDVVRIARAVKELLDEVELPAFIKTTGQAGLHILIPLGGQCTHAQSRDLAHVLARLVADQLPAIATIERVIAARRGRVYLDYLQNGYGKTIVAPFSVRPKPGAPVSTPLEWKDVNAKLDPAKLTIKTVPRRMEKKGDPMVKVLTLKPDLVKALALLGKRINPRS